MPRLLNDFMILNKNFILIEDIPELQKSVYLPSGTYVERLIDDSIVQ